MVLCGLPLPERPRNLDDAHDRGFDPASILHDRVTPDPLDEAWTEALAKANGAAKHLRDNTCGVPSCGVLRCDSCDERLMCTGPEPAITCEGHTLCTDCDTTNRCMWCKEARAEA